MEREHSPRFEHYSLSQIPSSLSNFRGTVMGALDPRFQAPKMTPTKNTNRHKPCSSPDETLMKHAVELPKVLGVCAGFPRHVVLKYSSQSIKHDLPRLLIGVYLPHLLLRSKALPKSSSSWRKSKKNYVFCTYFVINLGSWRDKKPCRPIQ